MLDKYLNKAMMGETGERCEYCGVSGSREEGCCGKCGAPMKTPIMFVFGVPVYEPQEALGLISLEWKTYANMPPLISSV